VTYLYYSNICNASGLADDTEHTLNLKVTPVGNEVIGPSNIHLDYMIVTQPVAAAVVQGPTFFDDTDPAFMYNGSWFTWNGIVGDMMQTLHGAQSLDSFVTLVLNGERVAAILSRDTSD
jgi:hypothetical protein